METKLDVKDRKILSELDMDARQPLSIIAKRVELSREVVNYRIKQLEKRGIIDGYYVAIDTSKLGFMYCRIFLKYRQMSQDKEKELLRYCSKNPDITWIALGDGRWDITIVVMAKDLNTIEKVYDELNLNFGNYLQDPYISISFKIYHYKHKCIYNKNDFKEVILGETTKKIEIDQIDKEILKTLSDNCRASLLEIADKLKTTPKLVSYRINKLVKEKIIIAFRAKINTRLLGYDHHKVFLRLQNLTAENQRKFHTYLKSNNKVIYITKPIGQYNLEFEILVKGANELHDFMRQLSCDFPEILVSQESILYYSEPILKYLPCD